MGAAVLREPVIVDHSTWRGRALIPVLVYIGLLVAVISSLGAPLVPTIADDYNVSLGSAQWSLTITLLVGAVTAPIVGRLADGPRRLHVLAASLGILVLGSILAALPTGVFMLLLIGRGMQGIGLALLPLAMGVARDHLAPAKAQSTLATLSVTAVVGVGLGYPLTGLIAERLNFEVAFWLAAVLGTVALVLSLLIVPASTHRSSQRFDFVGALLLGLGLAGLLVAIGEGEDWGWRSARIVTIVVVSLAIIAVWVWHELRIHLPMIDLRLMRNKTVLTANVTGVLAGVCMYILSSMVIRYAETPTSISYGIGASVLVGSLVLLPMSVASFSSSKLMILVGRWIKPGQMLPLGMTAFAFSLLLFALSRHHLWEIFVTMGLAGIGIGCSFTVMPRMIVSAAPPEDTGSALALNQVLRMVGMSVGSALSATILTAHTPLGAKFPDDRGYTVGALVGVALCVFTAIVAVLLQARDTARNAPSNAETELSVVESVDSAIAGVVAFDAEEPAADTESAGVGKP